MYLTHVYTSDIVYVCDKAVKDWGCSTGFGCQRNEKYNRKQGERSSQAHTHTHTYMQKQTNIVFIV